MAKLVACRLYGSVLDQLGNFVVKHSGGLVSMLREIRMVTRVTLNANALTLLGHSEDKGPALLGVQVGIRQN